VNFATISTYILTFKQLLWCLTGNMDSTSSIFYRGVT